MLFNEKEIKNHAAKISLYVGSKNTNMYFSETLIGDLSDFENVTKYYFKKAKDKYISTIHLYVNNFNNTYYEDSYVSLTTLFIRHALKVGIPINLSFILHQFPDETSMHFAKNAKIKISHSIAIIALFLKYAKLFKMKLFIHFEDENRSLKFDPNIKKCLNQQKFKEVLNVDIFSNCVFNNDTDQIYIYNRTLEIKEHFDEIDNRIEKFVENYKNFFLSLRVNIAYNSDYIANTLYKYHSIKLSYIISKFIITCYKKGTFFNIYIPNVDNKYESIDTYFISDKENNIAEISLY